MNIPIDIEYFLANPYVSGFAMFLSSWGILDFQWRALLHKRIKNNLFLVIPAFINGIMSVLAGLMTENNASPRTIALYIPIMLFVELMFFGYTNVWGSILIILITSFQMSTLYGFFVGFINLSSWHDDVHIIEDLVAPVTLMNLFIAQFFLLVRVFERKKLDNIVYVINEWKRSIVLFIITFLNCVSVPTFTYRYIFYVYNESVPEEIRNTFCTTMIVQNIILFSIIVILLVLQTRQIRFERDAYLRKMESYTDPLTKLKNRRALNEEFEEIVKGRNIKGSLFIVDIDYFKSVNDTFGHIKGDELLCTISDLLNDEFVHGDIVSRVGGDEFCIFANGLYDIESIKRKCERLNNKGKVCYTDYKNGDITTSISIGVSLYPEHGNNLKDLYDFADKALYKSKESGRDGYHIYSD